MPAPSFHKLTTSTSLHDDNIFQHTHSSITEKQHSYPHSLPTSQEQFDESFVQVQRPKPAALAVRPNNRRSLTLSTISEHNTKIETIMSLDPAPVSPPGLSSSQSSIKSTSVHSRSSHEDLQDTSNFEEISLDNSSIHHSQTAPDPVKKTSPTQRPLLRSAHTTTSTPTKQNRAPASLKDIKTDLRATATLNNHAQKHSPQSIWQATFFPSSPTMTTPRRLGQRSPSPPKGLAFGSSPLSPGSGNTTPRTRNENSPILPTDRRGSSTQRKRKTTKELEQEFHDSDDELPEDAFVWNIPLTPRPLHARSPSVSPEREKGPERGSLVPRDRTMRFTRTKSWSAALKDLSADAQKLTAKLEQHFDEKRPQPTSSPTSSTSSSPRPSMQRAKTDGLPPLQWNNDEIDPLPVSKEKEKVLTRTRPSWLPPKCPKEEKKHLKEYQRMMSAIRVQADQ